MGRTYHYTYKVTFPDHGWFYFGVHSTNDLNDSYSGSPYTHKWKWKFYDYEFRILEFHNDRKTAESLERRLIRPFLHDPMCLNENLGGTFSRGASERGRRKGLETQLKTPGFYSRMSLCQDPAKRIESILKGQKKSVEVRKKKTLLTLPDGTQEVYESQKAACLAHGLSQGKLSEVINGTRPHHKHHTATFLK